MYMSDSLLSRDMILLAQGKINMVEGIDFYYEDGLMVLTSEFLLRRGRCCHGGCKNCPYGFTSDENIVEDLDDKLL